MLGLNKKHWEVQPSVFSIRLKQEFNLLSLPIAFHLMLSIVEARFLSRRAIHASADFRHIHEPGYF